MQIRIKIMNITTKGYSEKFNWQNFEVQLDYEENKGL
jgi:hypothetical protein